MASADPSMPSTAAPSGGLTPERFAIILGAVWVALATTWMPATAYTIDGYLALAMADAMAQNLSFFVTNGYSENPSPALELPLIRTIEGRLAPQYPGGWGVVAGPASWLAGARGVMAFNAMLGAGTIWLVFATARRLTGDRLLAAQAALLFAAAGFAVDYALGMWTHAAALFASAAATYAIIRADQTERAEWAIISGLALGAGLNVRIDVLFPAIGILVWVLAAADRPYRTVLFALVGAAPGIIAATAINAHKFGVASPLTYGGGGGRVTLDYYSDLLPLVIAGVIAAAALGAPAVRAALRKPAIWVLGGAIMFMLIIISGAAQTLTARLIVGFWALIVDFQAFPTAEKGLSIDPHGRIIAYGHLKRALLQSAPYLTAIIAMIPLLIARGRAKPLWLPVLVICATIAPFAYGTWFGGMANSMRYFLHCLPSLAILAALGLARLGGTNGGLVRAVIIGLAIGAALQLAGGQLDMAAPWWSISAPDALIVISAVAVLSATLLRNRVSPWLFRGARLSIYAGIALATAIVWGADLRASHGVRDLHARFAQNAQIIPDDALLVTFRLQYYPMRLNRPPALTSYVRFAQPEVSDAQAALVRKSFAEGRAVYVQGIAAVQALIDKGTAGSGVPLFGVNEYSDLYLMAPPK